MRISDWSSDVCSSDRHVARLQAEPAPHNRFALPAPVLRAAHFEVLFEEGWPIFGVDLVILLRLARYRLGRRSGMQRIGLARSTKQPERSERQLAFAVNLAADLCDISPLPHHRSEEHTSELQSLMRISYAVFCLNKKTPKTHKA